MSVDDAATPAGYNRHVVHRIIVDRRAICTGDALNGIDGVIHNAARNVPHRAGLGSVVLRERSSFRRASKGSLTLNWGFWWNRRPRFWWNRWPGLSRRLPHNVLCRVFPLTPGLIRARPHGECFNYDPHSHGCHGDVSNPLDGLVHKLESSLLDILLVLNHLPRGDVLHGRPGNRPAGQAPQQRPEKVEVGTKGSGVFITSYLTNKDSRPLLPFDPFCPSLVPAVSFSPTNWPKAS